MICKFSNSGQFSLKTPSVQSFEFEWWKKKRPVNNQLNQSPYMQMICKFQANPNNSSVAIWNPNQLANQFLKNEMILIDTELIGVEMTIEKADNNPIGIN